jgi:RNA polymerase sigma factor (sigma-70 family)
MSLQVLDLQTAPALAPVEAPALPLVTEPPAPAAGATVEALYRRHQPMLYRYCMGMLRSPEAAADAAQATWTRALVALSARDAVVKNPPAWLRTIARNECIDMLRSSGAVQMVDISALELATGTTPDEALETREQMQELMSDLETLSESQRSALVLREMGGLDSDELADALHTTPARATGLVADARRSLTDRRAGRNQDCEQVRVQLKQGQRTTRLRAHLDVCHSCERFDRRRRGRALSSLALAPWALVRHLFEASAPAGVKAIFAGAIVAGGIATATPLIVPDHHPDRTPAQEQRRPAARPASGGAATSAPRTAHHRPSAVSKRPAAQPTTVDRRRPVVAAVGHSSPVVHPHAPKPARAPAAAHPPKPKSPAAAVQETTAKVDGVLRETVSAATDAVRGTTSATGAVVDRTVTDTTAAVARIVADTRAAVEPARTVVKRLLSPRGRPSS